MVAPVSRMAVRIESNVVPAAPLMVIPSAIEMLTGEMKRFASGAPRRDCCSRSKPN